MRELVINTVYDGNHTQTSDPTVADDIIVNHIKPLLLSFDNITYEGAYDITSYSTRYCFAIDGISNILLFFEHSTSISYPINIGICRQDQKDSANSLLYSNWGYVNFESGVGTKFKTTVYTISKSNKLKTIATYASSVTSYFTLSLVNVNNQRHIFISTHETNVRNYLYPDNNMGIRYEIYTTGITNNLDGIALYRRALINNSSILLGQLDDLYQYSHSNFNIKSIFNVIDVDGIKYRQIGSYGLFIEDNE